MDALKVMWMTSSEVCVCVCVRGWAVLASGSLWVEWVSASLRMPCGSAAISVSDRNRLASVYYDILAIVLLRKESDDWRRGEKKESAGSECT